MFTSEQKNAVSFALGKTIKNLFPSVVLAHFDIKDETIHYYFKGDIKLEDLNLIQKDLRNTINNLIYIEQKIVSLHEAKELFKDNPFKQDLLISDKITITKLDDYIDLQEETLDFQDIDTDSIKVNSLKIEDNGLKQVIVEIS